MMQTSLKVYNMNFSNCIILLYYMIFMVKIDDLFSIKYKTWKKNSPFSHREIHMNFISFLKTREKFVFTFSHVGCDNIFV